MDFGFAIKKPFTNIKKLIIGMILSIIPIVDIVTVGYLLKCAMTAERKKLPEWKHFGRMFLYGLSALIITAIYLLPGFIAMAVVMRLSLSVPIFMLVSLPLGFALVGSAYLATMAVLEFTNSSSFAAGFKLRTIWRKTQTEIYSTGWWVSLSLIVIGCVIVFAIPIANTFTMYVVKRIIFFPLLVMKFTILGQAYANINEIEQADF